MTELNKKHYGQNIRDLRMLKGMKQETLGKEMGMAQQNISKMEKKELPTEEILERAAKAMGTTVEAIKNFDKENDFNFFFGYTTNQHNHPIKEVIGYFKEELIREHEEKAQLLAQIDTLKAENQKLRNGNQDEEHPENSTTTLPLQKVQ